MSTQQDGRSLPPSPHPSPARSQAGPFSDDPNSRSAAIEIFVMELRDLWLRSGEPKFSALAARSSVSRTSLNDAITRFDRLPSERVLTEFVRLLDPDNLDTWLARRAALAPPKDPLPGVVPTEHTTNSPQKSRPAWLIPSVIAAVVGMASGGVGYVVGHATATSSVEAAPVIKDGDDPIKAKCTDDAILVNSVDVPKLAKIELKHSPKCNSYWGRILRLDKQDQNRLAVRICRPNELDKCLQEDHTHLSVLYTSMLAARSSLDPMCVSGEVYVGAKKTSVSKNPIC